MQKFILSVLFLLIIAVVPSAANAATATIQILFPLNPDGSSPGGALQTVCIVPGTTGATTCQYTLPTAPEVPLGGRYGDSDCINNGFSSGPCFVIDSGTVEQNCCHLRRPAGPGPPRELVR